MTRMAHFRIDGDTITQAARNRLLSEEPGQAWRLLTEGLLGRSPGDTENAARQVLDGKMKLVGNETDGLELVPDDEGESYLEEVRGIYAGRVRKDGRWWRPVRVVTDFGPEDHTSQSFGPRFSGDRNWIDAARRTEHYAEPDERVFPVPSHGRGMLIFEQVSEPPFWWDSPRTPDAAWLEFQAAGHTLQIDGWSERYGNSSQVSYHAPPPNPATVEEEAEAEAEEEEYRLRLASIAAKVIEQAGEDTFTREFDGGTLTIARAPFIRWALDRTALRHLAPPWVPVSTSGLKLPNDNPNHTDWWLGAGLDLKDVYGSPIAEAANGWAFEFQRDLGDFQAQVITGGGSVEGEVGKDILVIPDLHPDHLEAMLRSKAVITGVGGKLAHLALMATERGIPIMLVPGAVEKFPEKSIVRIDPSQGLVELSPYRRGQ